MYHMHMYPHRPSYTTHARSRAHLNYYISLHIYMAVLCHSHSSISKGPNIAFEYVEATVVLQRGCISITVHQVLRLYGLITGTFWSYKYTDMMPLEGSRHYFRRFSLVLSFFTRTINMLPPPTNIQPNSTPIKIKTVVIMERNNWTLKNLWGN
jgi:hypothetical protein